MIIDGLRGFDHFELNDLGTVNLLVGPNNCGKTTVLESLQMVTPRGDLRPVFRILTGRGEELWNSVERNSNRHADVRRLFHGHAIDRGSRFEIKAWGDAGEQNLVAEIVSASDRTLFDNSVGQIESDELLEPVALRVEWGGTSPAESVVNLTSSGGLSLEAARRASSGKIAAPGPIVVPTASLTSEIVADWFGDIVLTPDEGLIVEALKIIEPSIERIATGNIERSRMGRGGILVRCTDVEHRIPIGSMGDGIWRILGLALALVRAENGILLVDEIDTGLHFTVMDQLWKLIYTTAKRLNVQVFATTHSRDCYESLAVICREQVSTESDVTIQRIERGETAAVSYTEQEIIAVADQGMEVR